jgi:hypothetical protein
MPQGPFVVSLRIECASEDDADTVGFALQDLVEQTALGRGEEHVPRLVSAFLEVGGRTQFEWSATATDD